MDNGNQIKIRKGAKETEEGGTQRPAGGKVSGARRALDRFDIDISDNAGMARKSSLIALALVLLLAGGGGFFIFVTKLSFKNLEKEAFAALESGNYAAALALYDNLKEGTPDDAVLDGVIEEIKSFLVAEANYASAKEAADEGRWFDVRALLRGSAAVENADFISYAGAKTLFEQAEAEIAALTEENTSLIAELEETAAEEAARRRQTEAERVQAVAELKTQLQETAAAKENIQAELQSAKTELTQSQEEIQKAQSEYERERAKAQALAEAAERERHANFLADLEGYVGTINNGVDKLRTAAAELSNGDGTTAHSRIIEAKALFEEARAVGDLRERNVAKEYQTAADTALRAILHFQDAAKHLDGARAFADDQGSTEYGAFLDAYQSFFDDGIALLKEVEQFLSERK